MRLPHFFALTLAAYLAGYRLFFIDRSIFSQIKLIHNAGPAAIILFLSLAYVLSARLSKIRESPAHVLALPLIISLFFLGLPQFNPDTWIYYGASRLILEEGVSGLTGAGYNTLPGYPIMLAALKTPYPLMAAHTLFYIIITYLSYLIASELYGAKTGYYAGLLTAATPIILTNHYFMLADHPMTAFFMIALYSALKSKNNRLWLAPTLIFSVAASATKIGGLMFLAAALPAAYLHDSKLKKTIPPLMALFILMLAFTLAFDPLYERFQHQSRFLDPSSNIQRFFEIGRRDPSIALPFQIGFPQTLLFLSYLFGLRKNFSRSDLVILAWIILPFAAAHDTKVRYLIPMFPAISIACAKVFENLKDGGRIMYFTVFSMALIAVYCVPPTAQSYLSANVQRAAHQASTLDIHTLGVITHMGDLSYDPHIFPLMVSYYSGADTLYLGSNLEQNTIDENPRMFRQTRDMLPLILPRQDIPDYKDLLMRNYEFAGEWSGGSFRYHNSYLARLYVRLPESEGPADAIILVTDLKDHMEFEDPEYCLNYDINLYCLAKRTTYQQNHTFGPISFAGSYGVSRDNWLGENIIFTKPPDTGSVDAAFQNLKIPKNSTLKFSISLRPDTWHPLKGDGVRFKAFINEAIVFDRYIDPKNIPEDRGLHHHEIDLTPYWGKEVNLNLTASSGRNNSSIYDTAGWGNPRIVVK